MPFLFRVGHSRRSRTTYFRFQLKPNRPLDGFYFELSTEDLGSALSKKIGIVNEIEVGRPEFDSRYLIRTNDSLKAKTLLGYDAQREIDAGMRSMSLKFIKFSDGILYTSRKISTITQPELQKYADFFTRICERLEKV